MLITFIILLCLVLSFVLTYPVKKLALKFGFMDIPKDDRRMHKDPIPRLGGTAIFTAFVISVLLYGFINKNAFFEVFLPYLTAGTVIFIIGLLDDKYSIRPLYKLIGQTIAGIILCFFGITVHHIELFKYTIELGIFSYPLTILWVIAITNIYNLIDGLDGLCCGLSVIASLGLSLAAAIVGMYDQSIIALIYCVACLGFLPHNYHPAKIFMGDTGAMLSGFTLSAISCQMAFSRGAIEPAIVPIIIFGIPVFDAIYAICRRLKNGTNIFMGDKNHVHHRLFRRYGHANAVIILYFVSLILLVPALLCELSTITEIIGWSITLVFVAYGIWTFVIRKD